ncbi:hypothetical protein FQN60_014326 [Etheostoma spectabile]|uniref:Cadherin domain-containing protein n=1 Tax=Etheostoma spectabile TaxID=54343 RepID=A0A5J5D6Q1_9PERO|nr:hypothetical protein FQN60_014326 [Etheostoma spectabile]
MDVIHPHFSGRTSFSFLLLILLQTATDAQGICSAPLTVNFPENNRVGDLVQTIAVEPAVTLEFKPPADPDNPFRLEGNNLTAARVLDYETANTHEVNIICKAADSQLELIMIIVVDNLNDNPPVFDQDTYPVNVNELSPVDTSVGRFPATDLDGLTIYYTLTPESNGFKLRSPTNPDLLVETPLDYDKVKNVQLILFAQDTPLARASSSVSFTASTTIMVTILDVDNRPPWFQPCNKHEVGGAVICQSDGYTTAVVLNEQETGVLPLKPGPLYAVDGDSGINEAMMYSFLNGDAGGLFAINPNTGNITMLKPTDVLETIHLTVLAAQRTNSFQFATTSVTVNVQVKSLHPPKFQSPQYEGVITAGLNPHITYYVDGNSDFSIIDGYLFMTKDLPEATLSLQVVAMDTSNDESATARLTVEVTSGLTTTSLPESTTDITVTTSTGESTTDFGTTSESIVSTTDPSLTSEGIVSTTDPSLTSEGIVSTTDPSLTSEGIVSTTDPSLTSESIVSTTDPSLTSEGSVSTAHPAIVPSGGYGVVDMAALGATLGVLLFICLVVIVVLAVRIHKGKANWKKIYEASMFQSNLGQGSGGQKDGIQYTNEAFQNDEDGDSTGSGSPARGSVMAGRGAGDLDEAMVKSSVPLHALPRDDTSHDGSDNTDSEKEVKPILTKERRADDGYKSVWFKEDIDPNAKEEVVIIPDSREEDSEDDEDDDDDEQSSTDREENGDGIRRIKTPKVVFTDADLDSGLGVKMEDPAEDSEDDDVLTSDL